MIPPPVYPAYARPLLGGSANPLTEKLIAIDNEVIAFKRRWWLAERRKAKHRLDQLRRARQNDVCVIAGNGPSLLKTDWDALSNVDVFGSNYAAALPELQKRLNYLSVVNAWVVAQSPDSFSSRDFVLFIPFWLSCWVPEGADAVMLNGVGSAGFERRAERAISCRSTVSYFNLQLAYTLGYRKVLLIGFDHRYTQPPLPEGALIQQDEADPNHFSPDYFKGKLWQAADTERMEYVYALAKLAYERDGREVVNCTDNSDLYVFRRGTLGSELHSNLPVRAIEPRVRPSARWLLRLEAAVAQLSNRDAAVIVLLAAAVVAPQTPFVARLLIDWMGAAWSGLAGLAASAIAIVMLVAFVLLRSEQSATNQMEVTAELFSAQARRITDKAGTSSDELP